MKDLGMKDLGTKHVCFKCQTRFYDLKKPAPICPKCGSDQREAPAPSRSERNRKQPAPARIEAVEEAGDETPKGEDEDEDAEEVEEEADE